MAERLPIIVLGGSDDRPGAVPRGMAAEDMLTGCKGALPLPSGQVMAAEFAKRLEASERFRSPILIGPRRAYEGKLDVEIVDAEGSLAAMIRTAFDVITRRFGPLQPVAVAACDILPSAGELRELIDSDYRQHAGSMFWWQMIAAAADELGASAWKPSYRLLPASGQPPQRLYPGHIVIFRPAALRIRLAGSMLEVAYRYRNRDLRRRWGPVTLRCLARLTREDLRNLLAFRLPILTFSIPLRGLWSYWKYRKGRLSVPELERHLAHMLLHRAYARVPYNRPVAISISRILSLAKDIDTKRELAEAGANLPEGDGAQPASL